MTSIYELGNTALNEAYEWVVNLFLGDWQGQRPNQINYHDAAIRVSKEFKQLLATFPSYASELSDAFALEIRQELNRMEDKAIELQPYVHVDDNGEFKEPFSPTELAAWMAERQRSRESAIVELLHGPLPPSPTEARGVFESARYKALGHRHKFDATIRLYQFVRECYEQHTPKQFALRPNLPAYYFSASTKAPEKPANAMPTMTANLWAGLLLNDFTVDDLRSLLVKLGMLDNASNRNPTAEAKGAAWAGLVEALLACKRLKRGNVSAIHRALVSEYGEVVSARTLQSGYDSGNVAAGSIYTRAVAFLGKA